MSNRQLLIFKLNDESFGVEITHIDSIIPPKEIVSVPNTPDFIEGLLSLRGKVYTIFNLRKKFNFPQHTFDENTKIVIVNVNSTMMGFIVDEVNEIARIEEEDIEGAPAALTTLNKRFVSGIAKVGERLIIILDLEQTLSLVEADVTAK